MTATCLLMDMSNDGMNLDRATRVHLLFQDENVFHSIKHNVLNIDWTGLCLTM